MSNLTLGITKVGDLLNKNTITQNKNGKPIEKINLLIPEYQRPYKWTAKNANQLLDDIIFAKNENKEVYRVGTLILHKDENGYNIVDGQQRITTFSLLFKALGVKNISFLDQRLINNPYNKYNVINNYRTLKRRSDNLTKGKKEILEYIQNNCEMIVVITEDISEAFQFFDSQNARGKKLYPHDLLKAYHLREMNDFDADNTEKTVKIWEDLDQKKLADLFSEYLYRIKEWVKGNKTGELNEQNIDIFKGVNSHDNFPYAQYYKGAYAYADNINRSAIPFVTGMQKLIPFQLDTPIIAGKPFFDYTKHYFDILEDIKNNDKYIGYFINDNEVVKTLELPKYKNGVGNGIARKMLDTAILLYVDRFCPEKPSKADIEMLDQFFIFAFIWAYSLRAQYQNLGWAAAQNYIMGNSNKELLNSFNIYKIITESDSPIILLSILSDKLVPLSFVNLPIYDKNNKAKLENVEKKDDKGVYQNYLYFFLKYNFWRGEK
ncbi:MAG: DUF262 domain-containing protein [Ruminococcaceae bacterium]|nr:DUF262 domain-containing protein [Oscillospiraceae bacterium]